MQGATTKTINGREYEFTPLYGGLATYRTIIGYLLPAIGGALEALIKPLTAAGVLQEGQDLTIDVLRRKAPAILHAAAESGALRFFGEQVGGLLHEPKFVAAVHKLFGAGLAVDDHEVRNVDEHFGRHLGDYLPAVIGVLEANYRGAFTDAFGARLTSLAEAGAGTAATKG